MPDLKWQDYQTAQNSRPKQPAANADTRNSLTFILTDGGLEVRDPEFFVLQSYDTPQSLSKSGVPAPTAAAASVIVTTPPKVDPDVKTAVSARKETTGLKVQVPVFSEAQTIANLPSVSLITDFIKYDDQLLMASTNGAQIQIFNVAHDLKLIASGAEPGVRHTRMLENHRLQRTVDVPDPGEAFECSSIRGCCHDPGAIRAPGGRMHWPIVRQDESRGVAVGHSERPDGARSPDGNG